MACRSPNAAEGLGSSTANNGPRPAATLVAAPEPLRVRLECYILDKSGTTVADKDFGLVEKRSNTYEESKTDLSLESAGTFEKMVL